ncbi:MAG: hypothetical protein A2499_02410 [Stygiobacter sp. RIFOXYC12_FULL_38_8]|nr:MAG: hypothetical protein FD122_812 [Stygiobacter sp.]KAF0210993.1 MAG: hypothetical protein FD178_3527 [Ignavibacteria bacterium]OGU63512.1 MAG: hypothetical protein A2X62_00540 [Stygiobacter sp. GWC2_38_9]OGU86048.1 MAG: hypothetical protein A2279_07430 [Stygiobacter sp. RIFOXYA12_FULL_38_9]OGV07385.1 MAG: hypothetical protein A2299_01015 [Stygiobacter sp. RIFOXYB2_FULL_37_11]OGV14688.1 MAG: hypothetical protein A2440_09285 [Stygiobacter sp. RIFOXYC2_FULL_38_25]OGV18259.1 MAG: hypothetic
MLSSKHKIKVLILENDRSRFEYMLEQFQYLIRDIEATELELASNNKDYHCVITVSKNSQFALVIEVLNLNGFVIQTNDKKVQEILDKINQKYIDELTEYISTVEFKKGVNKTHPGLEKLITDGNYSELIKISKDITYSPETIKTARSGISRAVTNCMIKTIENVSKFKITIDEGVKILLAVATDSDLKYLKQDELMMQAANVGFELCTKNNEAISNLIKISNQKNVDYLINLKAAAKFSEIALSDETKYKSQIKFATRELNVRWLMNLVEPFRDKLSDEENENIDKLIEYIKSFFS